MFLRGTQACIVYCDSLLQRRKRTADYQRHVPHKVRQLADAGKISDESRILFVNDGSKDKTWEIITALSAKDPCFQGIAQSRNRGHQRAVWAGLMEAEDRCDIAISIDCDGQDDINAMDAMVDAYLDGCEIVYGVRSKRDTDTFFKRFTAEGFYKLLSAMGAEVCLITRIIA